MKLKLLLIGLVCCATAVNAEKAPDVSSSQVDAMQQIMQKITDCQENAPGSPEELFKIISGATKTTTRELPVQGAVTEALAKGYRIACYHEGSEEVVASTDPTILGKSVRDIKTSDGRLVRDLAVEELKKSANDKAVFTYITPPKVDAIPVNGKLPTSTRVVFVAGRKAFKAFQSDKKFLCTIGAEAAGG